jgi:hypothetical protein
MGYANCTVNNDRSGVSCNPNPVPVSRATQDGVTWTFANAGCTFTGVLIGNVPAPVGEFGTPVIGTNRAGRSTMSVSDSVTDTNTYSYTVLYTDPDGNPQRFDPQIKNNP